jgi:ribosome-associated toxin RatA of RatAB toxin-antitoxin module
MKKAVLEGEAYAPVEDVYDFFMDFKNYGKYSEYVDEVRVVENGGLPEWEIDFKWWIVRYTARSKLVDYEENDYIEWQVTKDVDVHGMWKFEEVDDEHTHVELDLLYDPRTASKANPLTFFSTQRLIAMARPVVDRHVSKVLRRVANEIEGKPREVDYTIRPADPTENDEFLALLPDDRIQSDKTD